MLDTAHVHTELPPATTTVGSDATSKTPPTVPRTRARLIASWVGTAAASIVLAVGLRTFVAETYVIPSESMVPTLAVADHIFVEKSLIDLNGLHTGDLVVFDRPASLPTTVPDNLIKRVIAVGGDRVEAQGGVVRVNGQALDEPYVAGSTSSFAVLTVPKGELFVMGDNRDNSADSRVFGPIPESSVIGSAMARIWPLGRIGSLG